MLLTRSNIVISHQVANYGMGGQYEPHFDFSRVRPDSLVLSEGPVPVGLRRLGLLEALQPPLQAPPPPHSLLLEKLKSGARGLQSPVQPGCFPWDVGSVLLAHPCHSLP